MSASGPKIEDLVVRIKPLRNPWRTRLGTLSSKAVVAAVAFLGVVFLGVTILVLRDAGSYSRRKIEFPALPQLEGAIAAAQEKLREDPHDISALVELGTLHFEKGREFYADAINELEEARELGALDPRIFYCLGIMYQEVGLYSFALEEYKRFLRHYPEDKEIRLLAAKLLYKQGSYPEAVAEYERLKYHYPHDSLVEENLGLSLWGAKEVERALESFNQLKAMGPEQAKRAHFYLGQIAFEQGRYQEALENFVQCESQEAPAGFGLPVAQLYTAMAQTHQKLGRLQDALVAWQKVLEESPDDAKAKAAVRELARRLPRSRPAP